MDKKEFWSTKNPGPQYEAVVFTNSAFAAPIRLVSNVFEAVSLGGHVHQPVPMTIKPPDKTSTTAKLTLAFPRNVVGREFKRQLGLLRAAGTREPIAVQYAVYFDDLAAPKVAWQLFVAEDGGVAFNAEAVQVTATVDNPARRSGAIIYEPGVFTGLELI
ncbi:hypothetical protein LJR039_004374 [Pseudorhodoferax sp. LjRoot39]|uniref:hypothetical protein n=1 Tax=Pseudorhodoferax sp. LjRoot39 TaxID=3342328 RepID=UPI003ED0A1D0